MQKYIREGRSTKGATQPNDPPTNWKQLNNVFKSYAELIE